MSYTPKVLAFSGSTREGSFNKRLVKNALAAAQAHGADIRFVDLRDYPMPLFDEDLETKNGLPESVKEFRSLLKEYDGWLIASPEYNGSYSGVLKNAIDWATRTVSGEEPLACFNDKVVVLFSASPGRLGGIRGLTVLRTLLSGIGVIVLPQQVAVPFAHKAFSEVGQFLDGAQQNTVDQAAAKLVKTLQSLSDA